MARPARSAGAESRDRVFAAAAAEFASRGYAGANVDRIARAARLNKAMIYYHFDSKAALYRAILRDMFGAAPAAEARPHFPPIWLREIAEGGEHVDAATLGYVRDVLAALGRIIGQGRKQRAFVAIDPMVVQAGIIAPLMFFLATARLRQKIERTGAKRPSLSRDFVVAHIQRLT